MNQQPEYVPGSHITNPRHRQWKVSHSGCLGTMNCDMLLLSLHCSTHFSQNETILHHRLTAMFVGHAWFAFLPNISLQLARSRPPIRFRPADRVLLSFPRPSKGSCPLQGELSPPRGAVHRPYAQSMSYVRATCWFHLSLLLLITAPITSTPALLLSSAPGSH